MINVFRESNKDVLDLILTPELILGSKEKFNLPGPLSFLELSTYFRGGEKKALQSYVHLLFH